MDMKKIFIGITPTINDIEDNNLFTYYDKYVKTYIKQILDNKCIPICLNYNKDDIIEEQLKLCDALILPGNSIIRKPIFKILDYAYQNKIPVLGICLGMQELAIYSYLMDNKKDLENKILYKLPDNKHNITTANNLKKSLHQVKLIKDSLLYDCYKKNKINVYSFHNYAIKSVNNNFKITGYSLDGVIEVIESNTDWLALGVQFHPELEKNNKLIKYFIKKVRV